METIRVGQIVTQCEGCDKMSHIDNVGICKVYANTSVQWRRGNCPMATHTKVAKVGSQLGNTKLNPLKASKRQMANIK